MEPSQESPKLGAEAVLNLQPKSSVSIAYHSLFGPHDELILLELDEKLFPDIIHQRVSLRGQPEDDAVLCTQTKTYSIKFVGTSNSVFLIPPPDNSLQEYNEKVHDNKNVASVIKVATGTMELVEVAPKLDKLKVLLSQNPYNFDEESKMDILEELEHRYKSLYRWEDLANKIQASDEELKSGLEALSAVEINGYWRILDDKYMNRVLEMILRNIILNDWSFCALDEDEVVSALEINGFPQNIGRHCLNVYGNKINDDASGNRMWRLDERQVCVHFAREILKRGKMKLEIFTKEWMQMIPEGMHASFDMLEGQVLTEKLGIETWVYYFSVSSLPSVPLERFSILFCERPKWEWKDLQPYVRDLNVPGLSSEGLLLKYTRRTQPTMDAEPIFSAR